MKEYCEHYTLDCQAEKMTCEGCGYYKKSADELFEDLGYEKLNHGNLTKELYESKNKQIWFWKAETIEVNDIDGDSMDISMQELKAINKKVEELGWK